MAIKPIRRAAVIGGGVMGRGIAAHLANARIPCYLFDIVPKAGPNDDINDPAFRNKYAAGAIEAIRKGKPSPIFSKKDLELITPANTEDHLELLGECDFIIEAVPEKMPIKQGTFDKIEAHARPDAIVASNTSGLSIKGMLEGRSAGFKDRFLVMHFFNPVRYMNLLEIIPGEETDKEIVDAMVDFAENTLGKGVVFAKDTTNFIANRIGVHGMMSIMHTMDKYDMTVPGVDVVFGKAMGRAKSAVFGTADIVGLDTFVNVAQNCYDTLTEDEERDIFQVPEYISTMVEKGWTGRKAGQGFTKREGREVYALNLKTMEYEPRGDKPEFDSVSSARGPVEKRVRKIVVEGEDNAAAFAREVTLKSLAYTARRMGEIADDVVNVDRAMRWGFNWELGPFEIWDAIGVKWAYDAMKKHDIDVPQWVTKMVEAGHESFYKWDGATEKYYDYATGDYKDMPRSEQELNVDLLKRQDAKLESNDGASIYDGGDGVLVLEFHSKANTIDLDVISMMEKAIEHLEGGAQWKGLVVANDADNFSVGANVGLVVGAANSGAFDQIEELIRRFQDVNQALRYTAKPVVTAPTGMTLGGGAEVTMSGNAIVASGELYIGLVEFGVGLIPGGGGNLQMMRNVFGNYANDKTFPADKFIQKVFMNIGMAHVATSAEEGIEAGFLLAERDTVVLNRQHLLHMAKQRVLGLANSGFRAPRQMQFRLPGRDGAATIDMLLYSMVENNQISDHDRLIGQKLAHVLSGGDTTTQYLVSEQTLLDLEREAFLSLCGEEKTKARMIHMAMKNKPLRN